MPWRCLHIFEVARKKCWILPPLYWAWWNNLRSVYWQRLSFWQNLTTSVSCATMFVGGCLLFSSSRTQKLVSLSSAEAEVYSCSSGASDAIIQTLSMDDRQSICVPTVQGQETTPETGSWPCQAPFMPHTLQQLVADGVIRPGVVAGSTNPADIGTKRLPCGWCVYLACSMFPVVLLKELMTQAMSSARSSIWCHL